MTMQKRKKDKPAENNGAQPEDDDQPRIAWHKLDIETTLDLLELHDTGNEANVLAKALNIGIASQEMVVRLLEINKPETGRAMFQVRLNKMALYVEYVPASWFVEGAPENPDFSKSATYKKLRGDKYQELWRMLTFTSAQAESASGN